MIKNIILDVGGVLFDDKERNINAANEIGIKSILFRSIDDIKNNL